MTCIKTILDMADTTQEQLGVCVKQLQEMNSTIMQLTRQITVLRSLAASLVPAEDAIDEAVAGNASKLLDRVNVAQIEIQEPAPTPVKPVIEMVPTPVVEESIPQPVARVPEESAEDIFARFFTSTKSIFRKFYDSTVIIGGFGRVSASSMDHYAVGIFPEKGEFADTETTISKLRQRVGTWGNGIYTNKEGRREMLLRIEDMVYYIGDLDAETTPVIVLARSKVEGGAIKAGEYGIIEPASLDIDSAKRLCEIVSHTIGNTQPSDHLH